MKQQITYQQLDSLSDRAKAILGAWMTSKGYLMENDYPTIGQMIEFLYEHDNHRNTYIDNTGEHCENNIWAEDIGGKPGRWIPSQFWIGWNNELCDELWKAVKEVLEDE